jgi:hypothetical protein
MQIQISGLMPGDVLIIKYNDTYWHTMLVVNNNRFARDQSNRGLSVVAQNQVPRSNTRPT